jgi:hypothetical protein
MTKIRKLNCFNKPKLKELIAFLKVSGKNEFADALSTGFFGYLHHSLPLKYKFLDESYILTDKQRVLGLITTNTHIGNYKKIDISQLFFVENAYEVAQQLLEFVIAQYGAQGATTFYTLIDDVHEELGRVFVDCCGFRQYSCEQTWKVSKRAFKKNNKLSYRRFKNSDIKEIADIYNASVYSHFKPALARNEKEFCETICSGLRKFTEYRYVIEDNSRVIGYFKISTPDNENYTVDFNYSSGYNIDCETIFYFAKREIIKRQKKFKMFARLKKYVDVSEHQEEYFKAKGFKCVNTKLLFVKDFFKLSKEYSTEERFAMLSGLYGNPSF